MSFKYVLIPAVDSEPVASFEASKAGGLTDDALAKNAKQYFFEKSGGSKRAELLERASASEKKQIASKIRNQYNTQQAGNGNNESARRINAMSDDEIIHLLKIQEQSTSCEISCLTIPTTLNGQSAVSMYGDDNARTKNHPYNQRATNLMMACGHAFASNNNNSNNNNASGDDDGKRNGIYGDVFVGRAIDDEAGDVWERVDITPEEVDGDRLSSLEWCKTARRKGGGGGQGGAAASLSKALQNFKNHQRQGSGGAAEAAPIANDASDTDHKNTSENGNNDNGNDSLFSWTQTDDEVELKFVVPKETRAKNVRVFFGRKSLKASLVAIDCDNYENGLLCDGQTWDQIDVDGSTFTLQDEPSAKPTGRELCISMEKQSPGQTWNYAIES